MEGVILGKDIAYVIAPSSFKAIYMVPGQSARWAKRPCKEVRRGPIAPIPCKYPKPKTESFIKFLEDMGIIRSHEQAWREFASRIKLRP